MIEIEALEDPNPKETSMTFHAISRLPSEVINPLIPPLPVLLGVVGGVLLLLVAGAVLAAILLTRKR